MKLARLTRDQYISINDVHSTYCISLLLLPKKQHHTRRISLWLERLRRVTSSFLRMKLKWWCRRRDNNNDNKCVPSEPLSDAAFAVKRNPFVLWRNRKWGSNTTKHLSRVGRGGGLVVIMLSLPYTLMIRVIILLKNYVPMWKSMKINVGQSHMSSTFFSRVLLLLNFFLSITWKHTFEGVVFSPLQELKDLLDLPRVS